MIRIVDFHTHFFPDAIAERTIAKLEGIGGVPAYADGKRSGLIKALSLAGVDLAVNLPVLTRPEQFDKILEFARAEKLERERTGMPIISFAGAHPAMEDIEEKIHLVKEAGILGIKVHPDYQSAYFDDEGYIRIARAAKAEGLIMVTHAGLDVAYKDQPVKCTPDRVLRLLDRVGGYDRLLLAHYGGSEMTHEVYSLLAGEDVYFDTAYVLSSISDEDFYRILDKHGEDKIIFASDSPWQDISENVRRIRSFGLSESTENKIFCKNALSLLGIAE